MVPTSLPTSQLGSNPPTSLSTSASSTDFPTIEESVFSLTGAPLELPALFGEINGRTNLAECEGDCDRDSGKCYGK
jgi:hypothetical protein